MCIFSKTHYVTDNLLLKKKTYKVIIQKYRSLLLLLFRDDWISIYMRCVLFRIDEDRSVIKAA